MLFWTPMVFTQILLHITRHLFDHWFYQRNIFFYGFPEDFGIHAKVFMDELVAHSGYLFPGNGLVFIPYACWDFHRRFSHDFKSPDNGKNCFVILLEIIEGDSLGKLFVTPQL